MMEPMSVLVLMGSGETAPAMIKQHRAILAASGVPEKGPAVFLDSPFAFQANAEELIAKTAGYFRTSVGSEVHLASWPRRDRPVSEHESTLALISRARWVFAGPGSPSYALTQWHETPLPGALLDVAGRGGSLVFGSAAACTVGSHAVPVYEIYKVGADPYLLPGLNLLASLTGIEAMVVPHYDNAEGGRYDTRFCYLGEQRLRLLEDQLPETAGVLGVDEHTSLVLDLDAGRAEVGGVGRVTLRRRGVDQTLASGERISLEELGAVLSGEHPTVTTAVAGHDRGADDGAPTATDDGTGGSPPSLAAQTAQARADFDTAIAARDAAGCVSAILDLEGAIADWSMDTLQSDETDRARRELRSLVVRLGDLAHRGAVDPADVVRPFVDALLAIRDRSRADRDYATADIIRERLTASGVDVQDGAEGTVWSLSRREVHPVGAAPGASIE